MKYTVHANIAPNLKQPAKKTIESTNAKNAAIVYLREKLSEYDLIPGGRSEPGGLFRYEAINHDAQLGAVVWVREARKTNPTKRTGISKTAYVKRPSQATQSAPSKRLVKRRKANVVGSGRFPNPAPKWAFDVYDADKGIFSVHQRSGKGYVKIAEFKDYKKAVEYAEAYANAHQKQTKITGNLGQPGSRVKSGTVNKQW